MSLRSRFKWALGAYLAIAIAAGLTLDGVLLWSVLAVLGALAVKSWIAVRREELE